jgi:hypothetical protein
MAGSSALLLHHKQTWLGCLPLGCATHFQSLQLLPCTTAMECAAAGKFVPGQGRPAPPVRGLAGLRRHVSLTAAHRGNGSGSDLGAGDDRGQEPNGGSCTPRLRAPSKRWLEASSAQVLHHQVRSTSPL